jgi:hypothetical protein
VLDPGLREHYEQREARVAAAGEPFLSFFIPTELQGLLRSLGFVRIVDLDPPGILARLFGEGVTSASGLGAAATFYSPPRPNDRSPPF